MRLTRREAFDFVWSAPMRDLALRMGLSDVGLKKALLALDFPFPPQGYWNKVQAGKSPPKPMLPARGPGMPFEIALGHSSGFDLDASDPAQPQFDEALKDLEARIAPAIKKYVGVRGLNRPHRLVQRLLNRDKKRQERREGRLSVYSQFFGPQFESPFEKRRLKVLNSILFSLGPFARSAESRGNAAREIWVAIGSQAVCFWLDHPTAKVDRNDFGETRQGKADNLRLEVGHGWRAGGEVWEDKPGAPLEEQLEAIALRIVLTGEANLRAQAAASHAWHLERLVSLRAERDASRREAAEAKRLKEENAKKAAKSLLITQANDVRAAEDIRTFVALVQGRASSKEASSEKLRMWRDWALGVADDIDPLMHLDVILRSHQNSDDHH